jgi:hypothetical protein
MQSDEPLYELAAKELAYSPRQGLLIKCMTNAEGDENRGKALYIKTRVQEMKDQNTLLAEREYYLEICKEYKGANSNRKWEIFEIFQKRGWENHGWEKPY